MKPVGRGDVFGLVLHIAFERLQHDMRQVAADDGVTVSRQAVQLRPREAAAGTRLVHHDQFALMFLAEHGLLPARHDVGLAAGNKRNDVLNVFVRVRGLRRVSRKQRRDTGNRHAQPAAQTSNRAHKISHKNSFKNNNL